MIRLLATFILMSLAVLSFMVGWLFFIFGVLLRLVFGAVFVGLTYLVDKVTEE